MWGCGSSDNGSGAVWFQVIDGLERPIWYLNRRLRSAELYYASTRNPKLGRWTLELDSPSGSLESAFHDYFHIVWLFDGYYSRIFFRNTNWTMFITQDSVSSRRPPFSSFMPLSLVYELTVWLGDCYD